MTYFNFIDKVQPYLKSVRILKNHVSFDMIFSDTWLITKSRYKDIEVIKGASEGDKVLLSFVSPLDEDKINNIEDFVDSIIKTNREREEKDRLFRSKVQELKNIFEKQKLEDLKGLKFDVDEISSIINSNGKEDESESGDRERADITEKREKESSERD